MRPELLPDALRRAALQLGDPRVLGVIALSLLLMALVTGPFAVVFIGIAWLVELLTPASLNLPWLGEVGFLGVLTQGLASRTSWVFWTYVMSPVAAGILGLFLERIVAAVEARHYPALAAVRPRSLAESLFYAVRFFGLMVLVSLGALVASFFSAALAPAVFVLANGYLIAREYFETAALRRMPEREVKQLWRRWRPTLWAAGALLALVLAVPFVNLLVPVVGIAAFTHLFHRLAPSG